VKPTYGLTDEQVETMILASFDNAEEDIQQRQVIEAGNEAQTILSAVDKGRSSQAWQQLTAEEVAATEDAASALKGSIAGGDYRVIRQGIDRLDQATRRFAALMMDSAVSGALQGQTMQAAGERLGEGPTAPHPFAKADIEESGPATDEDDPEDDAQ
jgi:molecular chaperone DnaK/molecular chaperone HscA